MFQNQRLKDTISDPCPMDQPKGMYMNCRQPWRSRRSTRRSSISGNLCQRRAASWNTLGASRSIFGWVLLILTFVPFSLIAQTVPLTLIEAVGYAMDQSPEIASAHEDVIVAESRKGSSWGFARPEVIYAQEGIQHGDFGEQKWAISQPIRSPFTSYHEMRSVDQDVSQAEANLRLTKRETAQRVKRAYVQLAYEQVRQDWLHQELELARELRRIALARSSTGETADLELLEAEVELSGIEQEVAEGRATLAQARQRLRQAIGWTHGEMQGEIHATENLRFEEVPIQREEVVRGIDNHDGLAISRGQVNRAEIQRQLAVSRYTPDFRFDLFRLDYGNGFDFHGFEIGVSIPLWFAFQESKAVVREKARLRQAQWGLESETLRLEEEALSAWQRYQAARETLDRFRDGTLDRLDQLLDRTREGYRVGDLDLFRVIQAQRHHIEGQRRYYRTLLQYALSRIDLDPFLEENGR